MVGDRKAATENDGANDENGGSGVADAVVEGDGPPDRFQSEERNGTECRIGDAGRRPSPGALGGEAERIILQRLVRNPLIILASDAVDPLPPCHLCTPDRLGGRCNSDAKIYVGILRCNIRDLAYLCAAQSAQSSSGKTTSSNTNGGTDVRRDQKRPEIAASAQTARRNGGSSCDFPASAVRVGRHACNLGGQHHGIGGH